MLWGPALMPSRHGCWSAIWNQVLEARKKYLVAGCLEPYLPHLPKLPYLDTYRNYRS